MQLDLFVTDDLRVLMEKQAEWCVSIFMPTHRVTTRVEEDQIRFKNLVKEVENRLSELGRRGAIPRHAGPLEPLFRLMDDRPFWQHGSDGLAVFLARDLFRSYRLPIRFDELVAVSNRFHTKPLLPLLTGDGRFYVLALSQNDVRLFLCTKYSVSEVNLEGVPRSLEEALRYDEAGRPLQLQAHTVGGRGGRGIPMFHGQGAGIEDTKDRIFRFFQEVGNGLQRLLAQERAPMVIAAVDYLVPMFKDAAAYPHIMEESISGNPDETPAKELHRKAVDIVATVFKKEIDDDKAMYGELSNTARTSSRVEEVVKAAYHGRVDVLFVERGVRQWGEYDPSTDEVRLLGPEAPAAGDLLDFAAAQTLLNSGTVYAVAHEDMPYNASIAAIFRY